MVVAFLDAYYSGRASRARAALLIVRAVGSAFLGGRFAAALTARQSLRVSADGGEWPAQPYLCLLAGSVPEVGLGFTPFARCDERPGSFHAVGITGSTLRVVAHLPHIWLGRPWRRTLAVDAVACDLALGGALRFAIDGDIYEARRSVRVRTGPPVRLVLP